MKKACSLMYSICLLFVSATMLAQGPEPVPETPPAPIDDYIPLLLVMGLCFAVFVIFKRRKQTGVSS